MDLITHWYGQTLHILNCAVKIVSYIPVIFVLRKLKYSLIAAYI